MIYNQIRGLEKVSLCDWKDMVSAVIFVGGCNFSCPTCHNWELATNPNSIQPVGNREVMTYLHSKKTWLDGVIVTGGEPTIYSDLPDLISEIKSMGFRVNLHTNGSNPSRVQQLFEQDLVEVFSVDVKGPWEMYPSLTGNRYSPEEAKASLTEIFELAKGNPDRFYFRTTVIPNLPGIIDGLSEEDILRCRAYLPPGMELHLQKYRQPVQLS